MSPISRGCTVDLPSFVAALCRELDVPVPVLVADEVDLFDSLGLDSLGAFQMLVTLESMAGVDLPPDDPPPMFTLSHAHAYYLALCELADS